MPKITLAYPDGSQATVDIANGTTLMKGIVSSGLRGIVAECGGSAMCATCHVYIDAQDKLPNRNAIEDEMLNSTASERLPGSRLSCQIKVTPEFEGLVVRIPERQL
jgi:2Fe-2S ferredoxin